MASGGEEAQPEGAITGTSSVDRVLALLRAFAPDSPTPTIAELASVLGLPTSTTYRYVAHLRSNDLVEPVGDGRYRLTDAVIALAAAADAARTPLVDVARPHLLALRDAIDETVLLARRSGRYAYCIAREESSHPVRLQFAVGQAMPLHAGSVARVLLATMPTGERAAYLESIGAAADAEQLGATALARVAADGWTESYEEVDPGVWGCAAAIVGPDGAVVAALGTAGPLARLSEDVRASVIDRVREAASAVSSSLVGGR